MKTILLNLILLLTVTHGHRLSPTPCDENEEYRSCAPEQDCQPSCDEPKGKPCPRVCAPHPCQCKSGFLRDQNLTCIPATACNSVVTVREACDTNEVRVGCAPLRRCHKSCENLSERPCPRMCDSRACICREGYVRASDTNSTCVPVEDCSTAATTQVPTTCRANEQPDPCANPCQSTCGDPDREPCPTLRCSEGCSCAPGYRRETEDMNSPCVQCPSP